MSERNSNDLVKILASMTAHDGRNFNAAAIGYVHLAMLRITDPQAREYLNTTLKSLDLITDSFSELMNLTRPSKPEKIDVNSLLHDSLIFNCSASKCIIEENFCATNPIHADRSRIYFSLNNIITNALQAMPGGGTLKASTYNVTNMG